MIKVGSAQWLYMMEEEGLLDTRDGKINAIIKDFKDLRRKGYDISNPNLQEKILSKYGLNHKLTDKESRRIAETVMR